MQGGGGAGREVTARRSRLDRPRGWVWKRLEVFTGDFSGETGSDTYPGLPLASLQSETEESVTTTAGPFCPAPLAGVGRRLKLLPAEVSAQEQL